MYFKDVHDFLTNSLVRQNTASRIESTGLPNCIHISAETAELLMASGKSQWIKQRDDTVTAKGETMKMKVPSSKDSLL